MYLNPETEAWLILSELDLDPSIFPLEDISLVRNAFNKIMEQWVFDPQQITKTILRAEVIIQEKNLWIRKLVPRCLQKDPSIYQAVETFYDDTMQVVHTPLLLHERPILKNFESIKEKTDGFFPSFHPEVSGYKLSLYPNELKLRAHGLFFENLDSFDPIVIKAKHILSKVLDLLRKFMVNHVKGYIKRVQHDVLVDKVLYQERYQLVKEQFGHWALQWPESTDPSKFVFEELGIATFLILLWDDFPTSFVDLGCGNGFLTNTLSELGHLGLGIDLATRKIWSHYPPSTRLIEQIIQPLSVRFKSIDQEWLIGNHSDELTPWIPIMAALSGYHKKFMILPCCYYDLSGKKYNGVINPSVGRNANYHLYLQSIMELCGYSPEPEYLRIPSTKNLAWVGRKRTFDQDDLKKAQEIQDNIYTFISPFLSEH